MGNDVAWAETLSLPLSVSQRGRGYPHKAFRVIRGSNPQPLPSLLNRRHQLARRYLGIRLDDEISAEQILGRLREHLHHQRAAGHGWDNAHMPDAAFSITASGSVTTEQRQLSRSTTGKYTRRRLLTSFEYQLSRP